MEKIFKVIRKITIPPIFAAALLITLYIVDANCFGSIWHLVAAIFWLAVLPSLGYPLQRYIPKYKDRGREGQRSLAMVFSFVGYILGVATAFVFSAPLELKTVYLEYLLCGVGVILLNKVLGVKASGHACGITGPVIMLVYFGLYVPAIIAAMLVLPVYVSSVRTKQHTLPELLCGSAIPAAVLLIIVILRLALFGW